MKRSRKPERLFFIFVALVAAAFLWLFYKPTEARIIFVGDMFFDRYVRQVAYNEGGDFIFSCLDGALGGADLVVGNLEGPITDNPSVSLGSKEGSPANYTFTFAPWTAELLWRQNIKLVNLGNNHINNFGENGMVSTKKYLDEAGVDYFYPQNVFRTEINGVKFSFISYNQFGGESVPKTADKIKEESDAGRAVIVYAHWGEEYSPPTSGMRRAAKIFAEAGARAVVGSHPHVVLESERIGETLIYYSLGNFIFDQYWNKEVSTGLMLELQIKNGSITPVERKVELQKTGRTCLAGS